ncbi:MAG: type II CAAX endopeptidase family protein [Vicinamibacteraceae bacterium]
MTASAPEGSVARRRGTSAIWLALALFVAVWAVRATVGYQIDLALDPADRAIYSNGVKLALWAMPAAAFAFWIRGERRLASLRLGPPAARTLPLTVALILAYLAGVAWDVAHKHGVTLGQLGAALADRGLANFAGAVPSAFAEEVLFRGLVLTELTERWGFWRANAVSGAMFVAIHWPHRIWRDGMGLGVVADAPALFALALALGFVTWRTGSIWPAVVFHAANNTLSGVL